MNILSLLPGTPSPCDHSQWWETRLLTIEAITNFTRSVGASPLDQVGSLMIRTVTGQQEKEMVLYAKHCALCYTQDPSKLVTCSRCHMVSYCSAEHQVLSTCLCCGCC